MAFENDLVDLGYLISEARDLIRRASEVAADILASNPHPGADWPAMGVLVDQLDVAERFLATLPGASVAGAIEAAGEHLDEMSDRADGLSY